MGAQKQQTRSRAAWELARRQHGVVARRDHRRLALPERSIVSHQGIPVTSPVQTLIDLATVLKIGRVERAVNEADKLDLIDPEALRDALDGFSGVPGAKALRTLLDRYEVDFWRAFASSASPTGRSRMNRRR